APLHLRIAAMVLLFSSLTFVYLFLSSPAVVSAWSGSNSWAGATILAVAWAVGVGLLERGAAPGPRALMGWNISFVASLLIGLWLCRVEFPLTPGQVTVVNGMGSRMNSLPFYIAYLLSPVLLFNVQWVESVCAARRSRDFALPVILGMGLLVLVTILLIFTNAWGYVGPLGPPLRNRFYLPFAVAGLGTVLPLLVSFPLKHFSFSTGPGLSRPASIALVLAALAMVGAWVNTARPAIPAADRKELTILTYNMQQGSADGDTEGPGAGKRNYTAQLEFIRSVNADIIGLQESDTARPSGGNVNAPLYFAQKLGYHLYYGPSTVAGTFGTAILSRYPLENPRTFYTYSTVDEVGTAVAEIEVGGRRIAIFNNHPAGPPEVMHAHVDALVQEIGQYEHVISVGDYNFEQSEPYYAKLATVLKDSWLSLNPNGVGGLSSLSIEGGFSSFPLDMRDRIDHIFVSRSFGVAEAYYVPPPESETDHPAHWAKVQW
ncbi:MAG: endonuclease/exonuclease/phosphatase family protein, partial [Candidatus Hydrogenedentes bacterium]|nr:endonuclease/exonuclease/phosphatase family protein [Candidatus Hydrogenedentota bacterium]